MLCKTPSTPREEIMYGGAVLQRRRSILPACGAIHCQSINYISKDLKFSLMMSPLDSDVIYSLGRFLHAVFVCVKWAIWPVLSINIIMEGSKGVLHSYRCDSRHGELS